MFPENNSPEALKKTLHTKIKNYGKPIGTIYRVVNLNNGL